MNKLIELVLEPRYMGHGTLKFYRHRVSGMEYRRLIGALAWPSGMAPAFTLVLGEGRIKLPSGKRKMFLVHEYENQNVERVIDRAHTFVTQYMTAGTYADTDNAPMMTLVTKYNARLTDLQSPSAPTADEYGLQLASASFADDPRALEFYIALIRSMTDRASKELHFYKESKLPGYLMAVTFPARAHEHPAVAALGYAIAALAEEPVDYEAYNQMRQVLLTN